MKLTPKQKDRFSVIATSELASKELEGNDFLDMAIFVEDMEKPRGYIRLERHPKDSWTLKYYPQSEEIVFIDGSDDTKSGK